ncbi:MAG: glycosyltransferase family 9 protein [Chitinophagaceae bacterium]
MKFLIIRFSSIGDMVLTTPIIRCIKEQIPNAEIHFLCKEKYKDILAANPHISKFYYLQYDLQPVMLELLKEKYDYIIDLHKNIRTRYVKGILKQAFNSQVISFQFNKLHVQKFLYTKFHLNFLPDKSIVDRYFEGIKKLNIKNDGKGLDFYIANDQKIKDSDLPMSHSQGFVACGIGGQHETKKMPLDKWQALLSKIPYPVILLGGQEDKAQAEQMASIDPIRIYNACGKFSLAESADIVQHAKMVISHDTAIMHIAAAFKKKIIAIWGNTAPPLGMFPYYGHNNYKSHPSPMSYFAEVPQLKCHPCSKIGYKKCPKGHFKCMKNQNIDLIAAKVLEMWKD